MVVSWGVRNRRGRRRVGADRVKTMERTLRFHVGRPWTLIAARAVHRPHAFGVRPLDGRTEDCGLDGRVRTKCQDIAYPRQTRVRPKRIADRAWQRPDGRTDSKRAFADSTRTLPSTAVKNSASGGRGRLL